MKKLAVLFLLLSSFAFGQKTQAEIDSLKRTILTQKDPGQRLSTQARLAVLFYVVGNAGAGDSLLARTREEAEKLRSETGLSAVYHSQGTLYYYTSVFDSALFYFNRAAELRRKTGDTEGQMKSLSNIGGIYFMLSNTRDAMLCYEKVRDMETAGGYSEGSFLSLNNLGSVYSNMGMFGKALGCFRKSRSIQTKKDPRSQDLILTYENLAGAFKSLKQFDSAMYYAKKSLQLAQELEDQFAVPYCLNTIGTVFLAMKKYTEARSRLEHALEAASQTDDKRLMLGIHGNLAAIAIEQKQPLLASPHIESVMNLQKALNLKLHSEDIYKLYAAYYENRAEFRDAYMNLKRYTELRDSTYDIQANGTITELEEKYQNEKKEKENQLLSKDNQLQRSTRNLLAAILLLTVLAAAALLVAISKIRKTNFILKEQKELIQEKQKEILDSIHYAKRIQEALLTNRESIRHQIKEHFILFRPRDVVSGDFYWAAGVNEGFLLVTADCTGHGVPGAFMSLLTISKLTYVVNEKHIFRPDLVLNEVRKEIIQSLNPAGSQLESKDGMDASVCLYNPLKKTLQFAAANNGIYIVRNGELLIGKPDKMPVGKGIQDEQPFTLNEIQLFENDMVYTLTDGYADQFGGPAGKKFKYKQLESLLCNIYREEMDSQEKILRQVMQDWQGQLEQVDDICIIGFRVI